ncbi:zinc-binding dehydrogenase [Burkholderia gladioli]|uniref:zinc-binding dehydrogenase n=1 Tax=Burkholderia gladioli TaxID=28095 RepID=UPI000ACCF821|nr:zinc-binding dehydrogenase [Burkholderia gladioli]
MIVGGAGAVGSLAVQLLKATTSAFVIATGSRPESRAWCKKLGADLVVDHGSDIAGQLAAANVLEIDMVLSTAATADNLAWISKVLRPYGHAAFTDVVPPLDVGPMGPLGAQSPSLQSSV